MLKMQLEREYEYEVLLSEAWCRSQDLVLWRPARRGGGHSSPGSLGLHGPTNATLPASAPPMLRRSDALRPHFCRHPPCCTRSWDRSKRA